MHKPHVCSYCVLSFDTPQGLRNHKNFCDQAKSGGQPKCGQGAMRGGLEPHDVYVREPIRVASESTGSVNESLSECEHVVSAQRGSLALTRRSSPNLGPQRRISVMPREWK